MAKGKPKVNSTQEHLRIAEVRDGTIIVGNGELRQVLLVSSVNFALKSEDEQNAIVFQFQNFLNSLSFPIQIVMQSRRLDLAPYLGKLQERLENEQNELIRMQIADYIEFIKRLLSVANIMDKNFFVVVSLLPQVTKKGGFFADLLGSKKRQEIHIPADQFAQYKQQLAQRVGVIMSGLATMGLRSALLSTQQLVELFYAAYNPEEATKERLTYTQLLSAPVVRREGEQEAPIAPLPAALPSQEPVRSMTLAQDSPPAPGVPDLFQALLPQTTATRGVPEQPPAAPPAPSPSQQKGSGR